MKAKKNRTTISSIRDFFVMKAGGSGGKIKGRKAEKMEAATQASSQAEASVTKSDLSDMEHHLFKNLADLLLPLIDQMKKMTAKLSEVALKAEDVTEVEGATKEVLKASK